MRYLFIPLMFVLASCIPGSESAEFLGDPANNTNNSNNVNSTNNVNSSNNVNNVSDAGADASNNVNNTNNVNNVDDVGPDVVCVPEDTATFCMRQSIQCGAFTGLDNCGVRRPDVECGTCEGRDNDCIDNVCTETECRDRDDNDGDGLEDCEDPDCLGERCRYMSFRTCSADGSCI